jgi:prolyl oligopeptidase
MAGIFKRHGTRLMSPPLMLPPLMLPRLVLLSTALAVAASWAPRPHAPKTATTQTPQAGGPPAARVAPVVDTYFGKKVTDPYRWMETPSPELDNWARAQNAYTRAALARIPGRDALLAHLNDITGHLTVVTSLTPVGHRLFFLRRAPGDDLPKLVLHDLDANADRELVDPNKLTDNGHHISVDQFQPSQDGRYVAIGIAPSGSEEDVLHIVDAETARVLPDTIDRARFASPSWLPDGRSFFYNRLRLSGPSEPPAQRFSNNKVFLHRLGTDPEKDIPVFGANIDGITTIGANDFVSVAAITGTRYVLGIQNDGVSPELAIYIAKLPAAGATTYTWRQIIRASDGIVDYTASRSTLYVRSHLNAPRYKVLSMPLDDPNLASAKEIVPAGAAVITNIAASSEGLYVAGRTGANSFLERIGTAGDSDNKAAAIKLPVIGAIGNNDLSADPRTPGAMVGIATWVDPTTWFSIAGADPHGLTDLGLTPKPAGSDGYVITETTAMAKDGKTKLPLSIIERKGTPHDHNQPTLVDGYGAYGIASEPAPYFVPVIRGWVDAGGVMAIAHVRGGGELGEDWHLAGKKTTKQNTIHDFVDSAWAMTKLGYANPNTLAGTGTSAGGITIGGAITQFPAQFRAALIRVGATDSLREELTEGGPANIPEFGTVTNKNDVDALIAMDAYQHVKPGTIYPAVLLTAGAQDHRVPLWESAKFAARLQAAGKSKGPILLRVDYEGGHGSIGAGEKQQNAEYADDFAFLMWQLGAKAYQPAAK